MVMRGLLSALAISLLGLAAVPKCEATDIGEGRFDTKIRDDRASLGFSALLEIRGSERGLRIVKIRPGEAAEQAGLEVGDLIVALDGEPLPDWKNDLERVKELDRWFVAGQEVRVIFDRRGQRSTVTLEADAMRPEVQEELIHWVMLAERRMDAGETLYCHDIRRDTVEDHYVCHDEGDKPTGRGQHDSKER